MNKTKRFAAVLALLLAFFMLFSILYIALEADHDCCGEDCAVCAAIRTCENLLRNLLPIALLLAAFQMLCVLVRAILSTDCFSAHPHTLIALKVKLSD